MSEIFVCGIGAVSPAGWGVPAMRDALQENIPLATIEMARPGWPKGFCVRKVPAQALRPAFLTHPRLRRTNPISHYAVATALEALGADAAKVTAGEVKLGVIFCTLAGSLSYTRRFYDETLRDPLTASPLVFPETVFNAPASHVAALLGTTAINYTLVGDPGTFVQGLAIAADWLDGKRVDGCLVIGAEEMDWPMADAFRLFERHVVIGDGAGAIYLRRDKPDFAAVRLSAVTNVNLFANKQHRAAAAVALRKDFPAAAQNHLLCDGLQDLPHYDRPETEAWRDWGGARISPKRILGEGLMAGAALQCVAAVDALAQNRYAGAFVSVVGCNEQAIGAHFVK